MSSSKELRTLVVRPIHPREESMWDELMRMHHYLGFRRLVGESIKYVATLAGSPVALLGWGTAAFKCTSRDQWIGWSKEQQWKRLPFVCNNLRFLILPNIRVPNLASKILALNTRRLSTDWQKKYGHAVVLAETFVDPAQFRGTSYRAAGWLELGTTSGYGRNAQKYYYHGQPKLILVRPLCSQARAWLKAPFLPPELLLDRGEEPMADLNTLDIGGSEGLMTRLQSITDPRKPRGVRHSLVSTLAMAVCATLAGYRSFVAMAEWVQDLSQEQLARFQCRFHEDKGRYIPPSEPTIRRHLQSIDGDEFDSAIHSWLAAQSDSTTAISLDGKSLRGTRTETERAVHLLAAFSHDEGVVLNQRVVDSKTNEITEFQNLLDPIPLQGRIVTGDALHTQIEHARYLVDQRGADYVFSVKGNQPTLKKDIEDLDDEDFSPCVHRGRKGTWTD